VADWVERTSRGFVVSEIQQILQEIRTELLTGNVENHSITSQDELERELIDRLQSRLRPALRPVINATGVIIHTNLGRAPLSEAAQESLSAVSAHYNNLEYDLHEGRRSQRDRITEDALVEVLGCEAATVVNNNAAAVCLALNTLAQGREVIVSRGELVEIGGSFRIPEIMARSGAILRDVGTTNITRLDDYQEVIGPNTAMILRVHTSNFRIKGFTRKPDLEELIDLAHRNRLPMVDDIGSGCLVDLTPYGIPDEPRVQDVLAAGADVVCFSADKILGGPQAGILAGVKKCIDPIRKNPLFRTYRVDKLIYGALGATLSSYRTGRAFQEIPILRMISMSRREMKARNGRFLRRLRPKLPPGVALKRLDGESVIGGGSCPDLGLPTNLITLQSDRVKAHAIESRLRGQSPPIILRLEEDLALLDLRTVFPAREAALIEGLRQVFDH